VNSLPAVQALAAATTCPMAAQVLGISAGVKVGCTPNINDVSPHPSKKTQMPPNLPRLLIPAIE